MTPWRDGCTMLEKPLDADGVVLEAVGLQHVVHVFPTRADAEANLSG